MQIISFSDVKITLHAKTGTDLTASTCIAPNILAFEAFLKLHLTHEISLSEL